MTIYKTAQFQVNAHALEKCKQAIEEFIQYIKANEPGTKLYTAWQQQDDPTRFIHFFIFEDEAAEHIHSNSAAVKHFTSILYPELVGGEVLFTDHNLIATTEM